MSAPELPTRLRIDPASDHDEADVIIVGGGAAGMAAAIRLLAAGRRVTMITKGTLGDGSTAWAQGGMAAVTAPTDSLTDHLADTLVAGAGLCEPDQVAELVAAAPSAINRMITLGAVFDRDTEDRLALGLEGGHHRRRIVHAGGDASGAEVARALAAALTTGERTSELLTVIVGTAVDVITDDTGSVRGLWLIDTDGEVVQLLADAVVLATGGIGQAWTTTSNPTTATGDGPGIALRAGAVIRDPEFVQFHPTVLAVPSAHRRAGDRGVLISEAVRGEGARLVDRRGNLIMEGRHPLADLAPRDVVASAIHADLLASGEDHVFLDGVGLGADVWHRHFPTILSLCRERGVDPVSEPIPIRPAEHYFCGGVLATLDGITTVPGLYAIGEVASTGVQGANRLASNSLTEAFVAGDRLGVLLSVPTAEQDAKITVTAAALRYQTGLDHDQQPIDPVRRGSLIAADQRPAVTEAITRGAGVLRSGDGLLELQRSLAGLRDTDRPASAADVETTNLATIGALVATAALARTESRGCHRRSDHDRPLPQWQRHSHLVLDRSGRLVGTGQSEAVAA
ncbi:L-aspartate oxidase [Microlunatus soli]|uniref:L-aspartate oxidase n=1 Tax=Microlunatus soli TaxID=630515 RepID=A0A1H1R933_9ACTN|nr:L-aspartate oxidase [Microlunatus soli]SDS32175.1 L-aspartate oxidase [Microlunatus soli]